MKYKIISNGIKVYNVKPLNLCQTLDCGQSFRWQKNKDNTFTGIAYKRIITVKKENNDFIIYNTNEKDFNKIWKNYFDLTLDYNKVLNNIKNIHPVLKDASRYASGIRILQQEPFETLCTFIISQNNNIKRIKGIVSRFCETFGKNLGNNNFAFPDVKDIYNINEEDLAPLRAGFRNRYLIDCIQKVHSGEVDLSLCYTAPYKKAQEELMKIVGVGPKVADCVLLFAFHRLESFPLDVWMKRAMKNLFPELTPKDFGPYAGIAQQYIFHYSRMNPQLFN